MIYVTKIPKKFKMGYQIFILISLNIELDIKKRFQISL